MAHIEILAVGKLSQDFLKSGCAEYEKRLRPLLKIKINEIGEERKRGEGPSAEAAVIEAEGERILSFLGKRKCEKAALCIEGGRIDSLEFAKYIENSSMTKGGIVFVIGGSLGLSESVKNACDRRISISDMTFTHQFARLLLFEQIYRSAAISAGIKYHK